MKQLLSRFQQFETPFYFYDIELLRSTLFALQKANRYGYHVHYAVKANSNSRILAEIKASGLGVDCVSGNEVKLTLANGFDASSIVLAGVGKTDKEIRLALESGIFSLNVESLPELEVIDQLASAMGRRARVSIRINPEVEAGTHHYITTGTKENKFGISSTELLVNLDRIRLAKALDFIGLHYHIGSQITDLERFRTLTARVNALQHELISRGVSVPHLNVGGGLGIDYLQPDAAPIPDFEQYFKVFHENLKPLPGQEIHFELGRSIVGQCGSLISRVVFMKESGTINFLILDAGMTDLMRPALYQAVHSIQNLSSEAPTAVYDVVGPICESSDTFAKGLALPATKRGDLIAIRSAGAYGETMRNNYNARDFAAVYYSDEI